MGWNPTGKKITVRDKNRDNELIDYALEHKDGLWQFNSSGEMTSKAWITRTFKKIYYQENYCISEEI